MATNEDINIKVHSEGGERAIGITPEQTERGIGINNESIVVRSVKSYNDLDDKPQINSVELEGDKSASDLGFADVAMSGSYNDLTDTPEIPAAQVNADWNADSGVAEILNKPTIPTKTSQLDNDSGFLTSESDPVFSASAAATITSQDITDWNNKSDFSGSYNDLTDKPTIPTKTSQLTNDGSDGTSTYVEADELAAVATSGSYSDLTNKPTIPTKTSDLTNDGADNTSVYVEADELATVATSGDYDDLINKPAAMTVDSALSWTSQNPVENQTIRNAIYVKNSSNDKEAGINIAFSDPTLTPYVHLGSKTSATKGINSVGIGNNAEASAIRSVAIGNSATASKREGVALGPNATAGQYSLSIGYYTETVPNYSTAVGPYAKVLTGATNATAIGYQSEASEAETVSVGKSTKKRRIVNVADGTTATDAATVGQIPTKTSDLTNDGADNTSTYVEADELATVATSGSYNDLSNKPTIPAAQVNSDWDAASGVAQILNKPSLATVATTGSYNDLTDKPSITPELVEMSYGESNAWAKFIAAYNAHCIVYCRASSNANPATGSQTRKAFMAYVNNAENPTQVEFQYYRSVSSHTDAQQGDQVFIYLLTSASGGTWSVTTRDAFSKVVAGTNMTSSYSNGAITLNATQPTVPTKTSDLTNDGSDGTSTYVEADQLATVATTGAYSDLSGTPSLAAVATTGDYDDLTNKPTIPTVNDATLTIQRNGTNVQTFTANASSNVTADISVPTKTSDLTNDGSDNTAQYLETDETAYKTASIPYGQCDNTSTATVFTATVPGITELRDGVCMWLKNGVVTSAAGFTININNLGAKPVYNNMAAATADTTIFNANYTMLFVYDSTRVAGGCWVCYRGYNSDNNTIGYQVRTNSQSLPMTSVVYRYRLLFTSADNQHYVPANNSTSTNATSSRAVCQDKINPFGRIFYYGATTSVAANARPGATALWEQYAIALGYSFNNTGAALTLTSWKPVYLKCAPQSDGSAIIDSTTPYVQDLPTTDDGKIYIFLGVAYSATNIELQLDHPVYYFKDGCIRLWANQTTGVTSFNGSTGAITYTAPVTSVNGSTGAITGLQTTSNLVTSVSGSSTDSQYPSAKLFYDTIGNVETILNTLNNGGGAQ